MLQLADVQAFPTSDQLNLTQVFTLIMSGGVVASLLVGWLMDQVGLAFCAALTLMLGQVQQIVLVWLADKEFLLVISFVSYTLFRSFLFPVFIASLTTHLGYKYFGLLNGIGFALSGVAQAFMSHVVRAIKGDCHYNTHVTDVSLAPTCDHGHWRSLHVLELVVLTILLSAPILDHIERVIHKRRLREVLGSLRSLSFQMSGSPEYGSFSSVAQSDEPPADDLEDDLEDDDPQADSETGMLI